MDEETVFQATFQSQLRFRSLIDSNVTEALLQQDENHWHIIFLFSTFSSVHFMTVKSYNYGQRRGMEATFYEL